MLLLKQQKPLVYFLKYEKEPEIVWERLFKWKQVIANGAFSQLVELQNILLVFNKLFKHMISEKYEDNLKLTNEQHFPRPPNNQGPCLKERFI